MSVSFAEEGDNNHFPAIISPSRLKGIGDEDYGEGSIGEDSNDAAEDEAEFKGSAPRPRHIGALLDKINDRFGYGEDMYASFIDLATIQTKEEASLGVVKVKTALKFYNKSMSDGMELFDDEKTPVWCEYLCFTLRSKTLLQQQPSVPLLLKMRPCPFSN